MKHGRSNGSTNQAYPPIIDHPPYKTLSAKGGSPKSKHQGAGLCCMLLSEDKGLHKRNTVTDTSDLILHL